MSRETNFFSQDVLEDDDDFDDEIPVSKEDVFMGPWSREFVCRDYSAFEKHWSSNSDYHHPGLENISELLVIDDISFPLSEILTCDGVNMISQKLSKKVNELTHYPGHLSDCVKIFHLLEFVVSVPNVSIDLNKEVIARLERIVKKVQIVPISVGSLQKNTNFHAFIFSIKALLIAYAKFLQLNTISQDDVETKRDNLMNITCECLVRLHAKCETVLSCECVKDLLTQLFHEQAQPFFKAYLTLFDETFHGKNRLARVRFCVDYKAKVIDYFKFYSDCYDFLLSVKAFGVDSDISYDFVTKIFFLAEKISEPNLIVVCRILVEILVRYRPNCLDKQKKSSKQFWLQIAQYFERNNIADLEHLSKNNASSWSHEILYPECVLLRFVALLFAERAIWDISRNIVYNSLNRMKQSLSAKSFGTRITLFFIVLNSCADPTEFGNRLCDWLSETFNGKDMSLYEVYFNSINVLSDIAERRQLSINSKMILQKLFDSVPLPLHGSMFVDRLATYSDHQILSLIDFSRAGKLLEDQHFVKLVSLLYQTRLPISEAQVTRCFDFMAAKRNSTSVTEMTNFFVLWLREGLENNKSMSKLHLTKLVKMALLPDALPQFVFAITNTLLAPPLVVMNMDPFVPCWLIASCKFQDSHAVDLYKLHGYIWPHIEKSLAIEGARIDPNRSFESILLMFQALEKMNVNQAMKKIALWFPLEVAQQLVSFLSLSKNDLKFQSSVELILLLLSHVTVALINLAQATGESFRKSVLVALLGTLLNTKSLFEPPIPIPVSEHFMKMMTNIIRAPHTTYLLARLRQVILGCEQSGFTEKVVLALRNNENDYYKKLCEECVRNPALKAIFTKY
ncbi:unnamed protein product [Auanema sp. JU1783]|nr:unnamed protein product [Auanema sp. JU1783]